MLSIGNKKYRNLQEQVGYNTECIKKLDEYLDGIKVEDKLVVIESDSGTFTDEELVTLSGPLAFISNGSRVWMKDSETLVEFVYKAIDIKANEVGSVYYNIGGSKIVVNRETGAYNTSFDTIIATYSKDQIDSIVANVMATKADKLELSSGLALKADVAGQAFTGPITAPSIIQDTKGIVLRSTSLASGAFISVCQNGNKLTFVFSGTLTIDTGRSITELAVFALPASIGAKLIPNIDNNRILLNDVIVTAGRTTQRYTLAFFVTKWNDTNITFYLSLLNNPPVPYVNGDYIVRAEATFLLSDNLAS